MKEKSRSILVTKRVKQRSFDSTASSSALDLRRLTSSPHASSNNLKLNTSGDLRNLTYSHQSSTNTTGSSGENNILLPITDNKKNKPSKVKSIDQLVVTSQVTALSGFDTPITIDIFSESGRYSKHSLEPLSSNRYSTSVSEAKF